MVFCQKLNISSKIRIFLFVLSIFPLYVFSQIEIKKRGDTYVQDFNSLASSKSENRWENNKSILGWYSSRTSYDAGTGASNNGNLYSYGVAGVNALSDRALGSLVSGPTGKIYYGVRFINKTCNDLITFAISFTGEQWRSANNSDIQKIDFQFQLGAVALNTGTWIDYDALDFAGPKVSGAPSSLDGNEASNRNSISAIISGITLSPGQEIWFRWVDEDDAGTDHGLAIDDFTITANGPTCYYRSQGSGDWNNSALWQQSDDSILWTQAVDAPTKINGRVIIKSPHIVELTSSISFDQLIVDEGATLVYNDIVGSSITINDEAGVDLIINGEFHDFGPNSIIWNGLASWTLGPSGTIVRTRSTSSNNWRDAYDGGISKIPPTANWIVRKTSSDNPSLTGTSMTYPNLILENYSGSNWTTTLGSIFSGASDRPQIKGNLDVGGNGLYGIDFLNTNTNVAGVLVNGNMTIRSGSIVRNFGTGFEIQGNLIIDGSLNYVGGTGSRKLIFSGGNSQSIDGSGLLNVLDFEISKSQNTLTLNRPITIDNSFLFTSGIVNSSSLNVFTVGQSATSKGFGKSSYVNGPVRYLGLNAFEFPIGKNGYYHPLSISSSDDGVVDFTCEYFHTNPLLGYTNNLSPTLDHISTCEYWVLTKNTGSASKKITLTWDSNNCEIDNPADLRVAHWNGTLWENAGNTLLTGNNTAGSLTSNIISSFSPIAMASSSPSNPLPLELIKFEASSDNFRVTVKWQYGTDYNIDHFIVERSYDGNLFSQVNIVQASGNGSSFADYLSVDEDPIEGLSYYRLLIINKQGNRTESEVVSVFTKSKRELLISNVILKNQIIQTDIYCKECQKIFFEVVDVVGRVAFSQQFPMELNTLQIQIPQTFFQSGIYFLKVNNGKIIQVRKIIL